MMCDKTHESRTTVSGEDGLATTTETFTNMQETDLPEFNKRWNGEQIPQLFSPSDESVTRYRRQLKALLHIRDVYPGCVSEKIFIPVPRFFIKRGEKI
jgi:hypothetical protein